MNTLTKTYRIPEPNYEGFKSKVAKLSRKAIKLGCSPIVLTKVGEETQEFIRVTEGGMKEKRVVKFFNIQIQGQSPMLKRWMFLGVISHLKEGLGNILRTVPNEDIPEKYRKSESECEHCKINRYRTDTYIVRHDSGDVKQVGSTCLRDFLGHEDVGSVASYAEVLASLNRQGMADEDYDPFGSHSRHLVTYDLSHYLAYVALAIRLDGWLSRGKVRDNGRGLATADKAINFMVDSTLNEHPTQKDIATATQALEWAKKYVDREKLNDYVWNLKVVVQADSVEEKTLGIAASIIPVYKRETEKDTVSKVPSNHFGTVGKRENFTVKVLGISNIEGMYGLTAIHRLEDLNGNKAVWFSSGNGLDEGKTYEIKATVKKHGEYKGQKQTVLTRCKMVKEVLK